MLQYSYLSLCQDQVFRYRSGLLTSTSPRTTSCTVVVTMRPVGLSASVPFLFLFVMLASAATKDDIKNVFSLSERDVPAGEVCPQTIRHEAFEKSGPGGGYIRIPHTSISIDTSQCTARGERPYIPLLDSNVFESEFKRNADVFPISTNEDLGLLGLLQRSKSIIGFLEFGDLSCGRHTFRKGTIVAVVRNNTAPLAELGLVNLVNNATYLLMLESNVPNPKRCVYRTAALSKSTHPRVPDCFPGQATLTSTSGIVRMDQLKHGARIAVGGSQHSNVFAFSHRDPSSIGRYIRFTTDTHSSLAVSKGHYVFSDGILKPAHMIRVGDVLDTRSGSARVTMVEPSVLMQGRYNPHTLSGEMLVNGFRVSSYTQELHPSIAHLLLSPIRVLWRFTDGWDDRFSPLLWLHGETKLRRLTRFIPSGPDELKWGFTY